MKVVRLSRSPKPSEKLLLSSETLAKIKGKIAQETELVRAAAEVFADVMKTTITYSEDAVIINAHVEDLIRQRADLFQCCISDMADDLDKEAIKEYRREMIIKIATKYRIAGVKLKEKEEGED